MLVSPETPISGSLPVSIPPSARRVLEELGALDSVDAAGLYPNLGNSVIWADDPPRSEMFSNDSKGYHTDLATLEQILLEVAAQAGVIVHYGHSARSAEQTRTGWSVRCDGAEGSRVIESSWVIDASGRHGVIARGEGRQVDRSTTTLAIIQRWKREGGWPEADRHFTYIESYDTGWAWSVPLGDDLRCYTVMIDQRETELAGCDLSDILDRELQRTVHLGRSREGAQPVDQAWACPASLYKATRYARPGLILAGDAGSFIDPLSSFGVKKALSSGWLAGIVANTALIDPDMTEASVNFFDSREKLVYSRYRESSAPFFQSAAQSHGTSYWIERAQAAKKAAVVASDSGLPQADIRNQLDLLESNLPEADVRAVGRAEPHADLRALDHADVHPDGREEPRRVDVEPDDLKLDPETLPRQVPTLHPSYPPTPAPSKDPMPQPTAARTRSRARCSSSRRSPKAARRARYASCRSTATRSTGCRPRRRSRAASTACGERPSSRSARAARSACERWRAT